MKYHPLCGWIIIYLMLMNSDGKLELLYCKDSDNATGYNLEIDRPVPFKNSILSLKNDKVATAICTNPSGEQVDVNIILIGVPTPKGCTMSDGSRSAALIGGLSNEQIVEMLSAKDTVGSNAQHFDSHIISWDGMYVMHGERFNEAGEQERIEYDDYFQQIRLGFDLSESIANTAISQLQAKIALGESYSAVLESPTGRKHMYAEKIAFSEWYFVTVMDYSDFDVKIKGLNNAWLGFTIGACVAVLCVVAAIFVIYYIMNTGNIKRIEEARALAEEANKAKSEFLSNMSHDIRTPMNAIVGMTAIATANLDNKQQVADCLKKISISSRHLLGLINDVLDMAKIESGKMTLNFEQISLNEVVEGITTIVQPQIKIKRQKFDVYAWDVKHENVYCDSVRINQVLLNLVSNAYKFTPEEGTIELKIHQEESPRGEKYARTIIEVSDNGIGMSEEFLKHVFESFVREDSARVHKTEGTGLGLSITKYIVDSMQGTNSVDSHPGEGTTFTIVLDLEVAEVEQEDIILPPWKMLVVDDDQMLCDTTVASLAEIGVRAESTLDGTSAIEMAVKAAEAGKGYDVILLDWKLPDIDGVETAKRIRKRLGENIPILLISAYDWSEIEEEARAAGINGFISKPLFRSSLFYGLRQFTNVKAQGEEKTKPAEPQFDLKDKRILIAEDNDLNWEIAEMLLSSAGLVVEHAVNGQECVDMLLAEKPGAYDAILMDIRMPVMNGLEATKVIRGLKNGYADIPIIAMTADAFSEDVHKCLDAGMDAHIAKPIDVEAVKATLAKFINKRTKK